MKLFLFFTLVLAFLLRVLWLSDYPAGFTPDEASFGYDAYSILKTGKDQWGKTLPLFLESFGDFKAPLYSYLAIPSVAVFGLNVYSVRLPNTLLGVAAIYVTYLLVQELREKYLKDLKWKVEYLSGFLLAINSWHVMLSRGAFEANLTTFFMPLGFLLFLKGLKRSSLLSVSALVFGLNMFTYHSARLVTPLLVLLLIFLFKDELKKVTRTSLIYSGGIFLLFVFLALLTFSQGGARRVQERSITQGALEAQATERLKAIEGGVNPLIARVFHNKYQVIAERFISNYKQYFSYRFLVKDGPAEATYGMVPGMGVLYWFEVPLLVLFFFSILNRKLSRVSLLVLVWILIAPIPASLATGVGYAANRAGIMMPAIQIAGALGFGFLLRKVEGGLGKRSLKALIASFVLLGFLSTNNFIKEYKKSSDKNSRQMLYGNLEAVSWLATYANDYSEIQVSTALSEPHIYVAFTNSWDPKNYQGWTRKWKVYAIRGHSFLDQLDEYYLGKRYQFRRIAEEDLTKTGKTLLVGRPEEFPEGSKVVRTFYYKDGTPAILVVSPFGELYAEKSI